MEQTTLGRLIQSYVLYILQSYTYMQYINKHMILFDVVKNRDSLKFSTFVRLPLEKVLIIKWAGALVAGHIIILPESISEVTLAAVALC